MEQIALEIARLNETLRMIVSIAKEEIRKSEELSKKYEEERNKNEDSINFRNDEDRLNLNYAGVNDAAQ
jgi:hypothetical protein